MLFYHDLTSVRGKSTIVSKNRPTIIYFHGFYFIFTSIIIQIGNAGNISHCLPNVAVIYWIGIIVIQLGINGSS